MTQPADNPAHLQARRQEWIDRVSALIDAVAAWSEAEAWQVERSQHRIHEKLLGDYDAPSLRVRAPEGELLSTPIALQIVGGDGRVDLEAIPTLSRVCAIRVSTSLSVVGRSAGICDGFPSSGPAEQPGCQHPMSDHTETRGLFSHRQRRQALA